MSKTFNINEYKKAKRLVKEIPNIIIQFDQILQDLKKFNKYLLVQEVLSVVSVNRRLLELGLDKCNKILVNKGKVE